jgi:hypothetical protein
MSFGFEDILWLIPSYKKLARAHKRMLFSRKVKQ